MAILSKLYWINFLEDGGKFYAHYQVGNNRTKKKLIAYDEATYKKAKSKLERAGAKDFTKKLEGRHNFVLSVFPKVTKWQNPSFKREKEYKFTTSFVGRKLKLYYEYVRHKSGKANVINKMSVLEHIMHACRTSKTIRPSDVGEAFQKMLHNKNGNMCTRKNLLQKKSYITEFLKFALGENFHAKAAQYEKAMPILSAAEYKLLKIKTDTKNKKPFSYEFTQGFIAHIMNNWKKGSLKHYRDMHFFMMWHGTRPYDSSCFLLGEFVEYKHTKVKAGEDEIEMKLKATRLFKAYVFLTEMESHPRRLTRNMKHDGFRLSEYFNDALRDIGDRKAYGASSYNWRHTALTQMLKSKVNLVEVKHMAGHASLRMLNDIYVKENIQGSLDWSELMPLGLSDNIDENWFGFLVESLMAYHWPELLEYEKPDCENYRELKRILTETKKRKKRSL